MMSTPSVRVLPAILILTAAPAHAIAQQFVCHRIAAGDTASHAALRVTGSAANRHQAWFRIVDPAGWRVIPKARYDAIQAGWLACVATAPIDGRPVRFANRGSASVQALPAPSFRERFAAIDFTVVYWAVGFGLLLTFLVCSVAERHLQNLRAMLSRMKRFGETFVSEFEQPLVRDGVPGRPIRSRLRCMPSRGRLEILLAPGNGRRYPNLSDHKKNVEYDVERIGRRLQHEPFIRGPLYATGPWVVIPFCLKANTNMEGAR